MVAGTVARFLGPEYRVGGGMNGGRKDAGEALGCDRVWDRSTASTGKKSANTSATRKA